MSDIYGDFDDSDDLEGGDEEFGGLGSILSWDDEEDHVARTSDADVNAALAGKTGGAALPPGMVSFSLSKDGNGQLYLPQLGGNGAQAMQNQQQPQVIAAAPAVQQGLTQANFAIFQQNGATILQPANGKQPQQQQQALSIQPAPGTIAGMVLQQVGQSQQVHQVQQQQIQPQQQQVQIQPQQVQQQVQQVQQPQQIQVQQVQQVQQQQVQQVQAQQVQAQVQQLQQAAAQQFQITGDANAFLRQLQVAQIQQQFNALQQQGALAQAPMGTPQQQAQQQAALQQQLQQLQRGQVPLVAVPAQQQQQQPPQAPPPAQPAAPPPAAVPVVQQQRAAAKPPPKPPATKTRTTTSRKRSPATALGVVSASDTDGELSRVSKKSAAELTSNSKKRKPPEPIDTSNMTPAQKAKANRDRNREHARNTRLRKKAYLEKLKSTVDELCKERDTLVSERAGAANLLVEMHNTRTEVLMSFFALRSTNEKRRKLWASILDESCFACVMPVTPYRSFPASEVQVSKCQRTVLGIDGMMADTASLHVLLSSLVDRSKYPHGKIEFCYTLVTEEAVVAGNQMMARWVMSTLNATQYGARMEVAKQGMLCCKFNSAHRITGLELMFDVMALMLQLKQAAGSESFSVIPNTVQTCQRSFDKPMVMTLADGPYTIVQVNQLWENMTGYKAEEIVGKTSCSVLQGPLTDKAALNELMSEVRFKRAASVMLVNYTKSGEKFRNYVVVFPLSTDSRITHYLALTSFVERVTENSVAVAAPTAPAATISQQQPAATTTGFNANTAASAGQMHQMLQNQAQSIQGNAAVAQQQQQLATAAQQQQVALANATVQQQQAALANAASAALLAQSNMLVATSGVVQGQMLPPPVNTTSALVQQQQAFPVQNVTPLSGDVVGTSQLAQV
ncbi:Blue-light-activated protein [Seminavis robusta]|uniref:Blue-light-activated protein n=1 Tax=Seminavis robusta TaxID=568900 RepID=A0A9N8HR86_9STRA|nr:Blue-light-activated protein [Seminavis robusta]|eukprot:Sro1366_g266700.1 Blue-light-activated protein (903) ;mRNA; r:23530-26985